MNRLPSELVGGPLDEGLQMPDFPKFEFSMHDVKRAGEALKGVIPWEDGQPEERRAEILMIFEVANNWIDSHGYPMYRIKNEAFAKIKACKVKGLPVARLKRMRSVRRKLATISTKLDQIQDLGGCRIILPSIADANALIARFRGHAVHTLHNEKSYITEPKLGGYRSHHMIFKFKGSQDTEVFNNRRIELQIRTQLQHAWATAVEAVGYMRGEELKSGKGNEDWLRLFDLMSAELAMVENCPEPAHLPEHLTRVAEIRDLDASLSAASVLDGISQAVKFTSGYVQGADPPKFFRIEFNRQTNQVRVSPHRSPRIGFSEQHSVEQVVEETGNKDVNTVLVSADSIEELRAGFPNYFGDVKMFTSALRCVVSGSRVPEYNLPPQETVPVAKPVPIDPSWLRPGRGRRWK